MFLKTLLFTLFLTASQAQASQVIRVDSKNDFIRQIAVTGDESIYGVGLDSKLYFSHNRGQDWAEIQTPVTKIKWVKTNLVGEIYLTDDSDRSFMSIDQKNWKAIEPVDGAPTSIAVNANGTTVPVVKSKTIYAQPYQILMAPSSFPQFFTSNNILFTSERTFCEIAMVYEDFGIYREAGSIVCDSKVIPGVYRKAVFTVDGNTLFALKLDGTIDQIDMSLLRADQPSFPKEAFSTSDENFRDIALGIYGRIFGLVSYGYSHAGAEQLIFQHITDESGVRKEVGSEVRSCVHPNGQMKYLFLAEHLSIFNVTCNEVTQNSSKPYEIICVNSYGQKLNLTPNDRYSYRYQIFESNKLVHHGVLELN